MKANQTPLDLGQRLVRSLTVQGMVVGLIVGGVNLPLNAQMRQPREGIPLPQQQRPSVQPQQSLPPTNVSVQTTQTTATLTWPPVPAATGYLVSRGGVTQLTPAPIASTMFKDAGLAPGTAYSWIVSAVYPDRRPGNSAPVSAKTLPPVNPSGFQARATGSDDVTLSWNALPEASYYWLGGPGLGPDKLTNATTTRYVKGLQPGTHNYYLIAYYVSGGQHYADESDMSRASVVILQAPILQEVRLRGYPICGGGPCPLPTTAATRWRIDPSTYQTSDGRLLANLSAVVVVDTPLFTDLSLSHTLQGQTHQMQEISRDPDIPKHYRVQKTDDGKKLRWFVTVTTGSCANPITFQIVNVGRTAGKPRSAPLDVSFLRWFRGLCEPNPPMSASSSPSPSSSPGGTSACPSGSTRFRICQWCRAHPGAGGVKYYHEGCHRSWQDVQKLFEEKHPDGTLACQVYQVGGLSSCR